MKKCLTAMMMSRFVSRTPHPHPQFPISMARFLPGVPRTLLATVPTSSRVRHSLSGSWRLGRSPKDSSWRSMSSATSTGADTPKDTDDDDDTGLPPFPSKDSNATAFDYFNQPYFFVSKSFLACFQEMGERKVLSTTLDEFFRTVWDTYKDDFYGPANFFMDNMVGCNDKAVFEAFNVWKEANDVGDDCLEVANLPRLVSVDFRIKDSKLSHTYDLECFSKSLDHVFQCHENDKERDNYVAPYFCFVQSSGMGKTKLLYEYNRMSLQERKVASLVIIPWVWTDQDENKVKDEDKVFYKLNLAKAVDPLPADESSKDDLRRHARREAVEIFATLDYVLLKFVQKAKKDSPGMKFQKVALLFDESQYLFQEEFGYDAYLFRCVRFWLGEIPERGSDRDGLTVAAVFAGTNSEATDRFPESDSELTNLLQPAREFQLRKREYFYRGNRLHSPFSQTTTMGSCL